jgi:hypothetical protein
VWKLPVHNPANAVPFGQGSLPSAQVFFDAPSVLADRDGNPIIAWYGSDYSDAGVLVARYNTF